MLVHGRNLKVTVGSTVICCARSCDLSIEAETIEVSNPTSGQWRRYISGRKGWSVSVSALMAVVPVTQTDGTENMTKALSLAGTEALLSFRMETTTGVYAEFCGACICTGSKITGTVGNLANGSWTFQGQGELYENTAKTIYCKGILPHGTGGEDTGYYLTYSTNGGNLDKLILNDYAGETVNQYALTPNTDTVYAIKVSEYLSKSYKWNGTQFVAS